MHVQLIKITTHNDQTIIEGRDSVLSKKAVLVNLGNNQWRMWKVLKIDGVSDTLSGKTELNGQEDPVEHKKEVEHRVEESKSFHEHLNRNEVDVVTPEYLITKSKRRIR